MNEETLDKIMWSVKNGDLKELQGLLKGCQVKVDDISLNNRPAIVCAADYGQTEIVEYLVKMGANVNVKDKYDITALLAAIWEGHSKTVEFLLRNGANKNLKSPGDKSYLDEAQDDNIKSLLQKY